MNASSSTTTMTSSSSNGTTMNDINTDINNSDSSIIPSNGNSQPLGAPCTPSCENCNRTNNNVNSFLSNGSPKIQMITTAVVYNVTTTTKKLVDKSAETTKTMVDTTKTMVDTTKTMVDTTKKHTHKLMKKSKSTIETNRWLLPLKWFLHFPRHWPRTNAIIWVILLMWILILLSMAFGIQLAKAEAPAEVDGNDAILAARAHINYYEKSTAQLLNATNACITDFENTIENNNEQDDEDDDDIVEINRTALEEWIHSCVETHYVLYLESYQNVSGTDGPTASQPLRFNWNRCWKLKDQPQFVFYPTWEMVYAARPQAQADYYEQEWTFVQQELYQTYLPPNATKDEQYQAFLKSIQEATGADACEENMGATAWFFFTIMTTMGFGNQAPVTSEGRFLVVTAGIFSLIMFGLVLGWCGYVILAIFDDAVGRLGRRAKLLFGNPLVGVILWATIWFLYALSLAEDFYLWWEVRLPEYAAQTDREDVLWFTLISTATIGLGDYYLQPEVMFTSDALKYSVLFMIGFVFLSTFFGKIVEVLQFFMPSKHNSLENRLAKTRVLACWPQGWLPCEKVPGMGDEDETDIAVAAAAASGDNADDQALLYRIERLKELKPDPPIEEDGIQPHRGLVNALRGSPIHSMNVELLQQEEALLHEWLAVVQHQQERALLRRAQLEDNDMTPNDDGEGNSDASGSRRGSSEHSEENSEVRMVSFRDLHQQDGNDGEYSEEASKVPTESFIEPRLQGDDQSNCNNSKEEEKTNEDIEDASKDEPP